MQSLGLGKGLRDQTLRDIVSGEHEKAHCGQCVVQCTRCGLQGARPSGQVISDIDDGNGIGHGAFSMRTLCPLGPEDDRSGDG